MDTKKEISDELNRALGVNVRWDKLSKEELAQIVKVLSDRLGLLEKIVKQEVKSRVTERLDDWDFPILRSVLGVGQSE